MFNAIFCKLVESKKVTPTVNFQGSCNDMIVLQLELEAGKKFAKLWVYPDGSQLLEIANLKVDSHIEGATEVAAFYIDNFL